MEMFDDYGFEAFEQNAFPIAYLLTFRTFGTWLHDDERHSVSRHGMNIFGTPDIAPDSKLSEFMESELKQPKTILNKSQRKAVDEAIRDFCDIRSYFLQALNVRSNHVHLVISVQAKPERIADSLKAVATKRLREKMLISAETKVWSRGRSRRYLWKPKDVQLAIDYVLFGQGDVPFELKD